MADNVSITPGSGTVIAADEVTRNAIAEKQQLIKISYGTDGNYEGMVSTTTPLPIGGTTAQCIGKAEDAAHTSGDVGVFCLGVRHDAGSSLVGADGDYCAFTVSSFGAMQVSMQYDFQGAGSLSPLKVPVLTAPAADTHAGTNIMGVRRDSAAAFGAAGSYAPYAVNQYGAARNELDATFQHSAATGLLKLEDAGHVSGDAGVMMLGVRNDAYNTWTGAGNDYSPISVNQYGSVLVDLQYQNSTNAPKSILKLEDAASANADAGVFTLAIRRDQPVANAGVGTDGDYAGITLANEGGLWVSDSPTALGGLSTYRNISLLATGISVKATPGRLYGALITNRSTSQRYVKLYDKATAPTVGTDTPVSTICLEPAAASGAKPLPITFGIGRQFTLGIGVGATTGIADADIGAPSANDVVVELYYK